jgi:hypothetical protein
LRGGPIVEVFHFGPVGRDREHVEVRELTGFLCPQRFEHGRGVAPALGEEVAETEKITGLESVRLIVHDGFEGRSRCEKFVLPVVREADIQTNTGNLRHEMLCLMQRYQCLRPLLAPHVDDSKIGVSPSGLRIDRQHAAEVMFRFVESIVSERVLSELKQLWGFGRLRISRCLDWHGVSRLFSRAGRGLSGRISLRCDGQKQQKETSRQDSCA